MMYATVPFIGAGAFGVVMRTSPFKIAVILIQVSRSAVGVDGSGKYGGFLDNDQLLGSFTVSLVPKPRQLW